MGKWFTFERVTTVWALTLGTVALLSVFVGLGTWISHNSANVASWVQAVGSIAAIASGFWLAGLQSRNALEHTRMQEQRAERSQAFKSSILLIDAYENAALWAQSVLNSVAQGQLPWSGFVVGCDVAIDHFKSIDAYQIPDPVEIAFLTSSRKQAENLRGMIKHALREEMNPGRIGRFTSCLDEFLTACLASKLRLVEAARGHATADQLPAVEALVELFETRERRKPHRISPFGIDKPQTQQQPAADQ